MIDIDGVYSLDKIEKRKAFVRDRRVPTDFDGVVVRPSEARRDLGFENPRGILLASKSVSRGSGDCQDFSGTDLIDLLEVFFRSTKEERKSNAKISRSVTFVFSSRQLGREDESYTFPGGCKFCGQDRSNVTIACATLRVTIVRAKPRVWRIKDVMRPKSPKGTRALNHDDPLLRVHSGVLD